MASKPKEQYVLLNLNGRIFPFWVMKNFKQYKLPPVFRKDNEDPCNVETKLELRKYQEFIGKYLDPGGPYTSILLYHGVGSGKTITSINLLNVLYNYNHNMNFIILIKASLHDDPWMKDLKIWLGRNPNEENVENVTKLARYNTLHFVHYDSPFADRDFMEVMKKIDVSKPMVYFIDEVHNFIRNVYSNINSKLGKRAQVIYEYILRDKKENKNTRIILISATPVINVPFELALMFNMLRPGIFPTSELEFNRIFITESIYPILNPVKKNLFERRILGLVSYYIGATPDLYAKEELRYIDLPMSEYQYNVYRVFEKKEEEIRERTRRSRVKSQLYRTYTRQACNFVFPYVNIHVNGELRPRPSNFRISDRIGDNLEKGKDVKNEEVEKDMLKKYIDAMHLYITETEKYFENVHKEDVKNKRTIFDDLKEFKDGYTTVFKESFLKYYQSDTPKSRLLIELYNSSPKMIAIACNTYISPGKVMVYSNYVLMEGIEMMKVYYRLIGYDDFTHAKEFQGYCEYHGRIDYEDRVKVKNMFNSNDNIYGNKCKVILLSPSATEGIQLYNIRQENILEPYWTEVRIQQVVGRGIRQCSHKQLPMDQRVVEVNRYKVIKPEILDSDDNIKLSTDQYVEDLAKAKANLNGSFLEPMREAAVDCELFKSHNMMSQTYQCFKFPEASVMEKNIGPAYKDDIKDDIKYDSGLNAKNSKIERIKVIKINAVFQLNVGKDEEPTYSGPDKYWYNSKTGMVYDLETHYPVGKVQFIKELANKLDKDTYIMTDLIDIPTIEKTANL